MVKTFIPARTVADYFSGLWSFYDRSPVRVHVFEFADSCPFAGSVFWEDGHWVVLGDARLKSWTLFQVLFHELAHVVHGDKTPGEYDTETAWALARGTPVRVRRAEAETRSDCAAQARREVPHEGDFNAWAYAEASRWWGTLEDWQDADRALEVARWARKHNTGG